MNNLFDRLYCIMVFDVKHGTNKTLFRFLTYEEALKKCREYEWEWEYPWDMTIEPEDEGEV